jgi:hypothetical protein
MVLLHDVPVTRADAWWVVARLRDIGRADDVIAAAVIERALTDEAAGVALTADECDAVLDVLVNATAGLSELRTKLAWDQYDRLEE